MATEFDPVTEAKSFQQRYACGTDFTVEEYEAGVGWLCDYIDALVTALTEAQPYVEKIADEWDDLRAGKLVHDIGHLL